MSTYGMLPPNANSDFNFSLVFPFEENFDEQLFTKWMIENWTLCFWYTGLYLLVVFGGQLYMKHRRGFHLRYPLAAWSGILSIFSICGMIRTAPELIYVVNRYGVDFSVCNPSYFRGPTSFWCFMFTVSKVYELGDTLFIVLRKQQLIFLHWYHHISVLLYVWYSYADHPAPGRWFMTMNYTVHSVMYGYYALRALRFHIPKKVNIIVTSLQLLQMAVGCYVNIRSYNLLMRGYPCQQSAGNLQLSLLMYFSYFVLFGHFFYYAYIFEGRKEKDKTEADMKLL